ncbi:MAG: aspartate aminotransferase family protein [Candidatus Omnitrophota bacterium]|nr:aspartate aminotransferase family protein [Candidatus Omnitrophota bacterium]MBU1895033.1 aspartate aminotransferase family protein [Candidatus Omnitrophota bacterium]
MNFNEIKKLYDDYVLSTYTRQDLCLVKGQGTWVEDVLGKKYLDFFPGWAVSGIGHCHPKVAEKVTHQLGRILHVSNNFYNDVQPLLAKKIIEYSFPGKVFFSNSGAEANEGAIKLARRYGQGKKYEVITMEKSFHGRTLATLTATGQDKVKEGFLPLPEGFKHIPFNNIDAVVNAVTDKTAAIMLEPIQGEGGINVAEKEYMRSLYKLCQEKAILLIVDEVQTCMGRTGKMFAYKHFGIEPDAMTLAKSLGGGFPIGALVVAEKHKDVLGAGSHASTFGGSPIISAAALGVFEAIEEESLLENTNKMGAYFVGKLNNLRNKNKVVGRVKGMGLMIGVEMELEDASSLAVECMKEGLLINCTQKNILRIMPPINVTKEEIDLAIEKISKVLETV